MAYLMTLRGVTGPTHYLAVLGRIWAGRVPPIAELSAQDIHDQSLAAVGVHEITARAKDVHRVTAGG